MNCDRPMSGTDAIVGVG